jgi:hypothetical protein
VISYIQSLPIEIGLPVVVGAGVLLSAVGTLVANSIFTPEELIENNAVGGFKYAFLAQIVATLLAFSLVDSGTRFVSFQFKSDRELAAITLMQKLSKYMPADAGRLRAAENDYIGTVVNDEWLTMRDGKPSLETTRALETWYDTALSARIKTDQEKIALSQYLRLFSQVVEARTSRVSNSHSPFENLIWLSMGTAVLIAISFNWFFGSFSLTTQLAMGTLLTAGVMMLVYLSVVLASPIKSPIGIAPSEYVKLLEN